MTLSGIKQDSFQHHCFDIEGSGFFQTQGVFIDSPGRKRVFQESVTSSNALLILITKLYFMLFFYYYSQDRREWGVARVVTRGPEAIRGPVNICYIFLLCLHFSSGTFLGSRGILSFVFTHEINNFSI